MREGVLWLVVAVFGLSAACAPPPQHHEIEMVPIGTYTGPDPSASVASNDTADAATSPDPGNALPVDKAGECAGVRFDNLYLTLTNPACVVDTRGDKPVDVKADLEVTVASRTPEIVPGGRVDLIVSYKNKGQKQLQLNFVLDPAPRFEIDAQDSKGRPAGVPKGKQPKTTKPAAQKTTARVTIAPGGIAKIKVAWNASNTKWATDPPKVADASDSSAASSSTKVPTTPLPVGTYTLRVVTPLTLVQESSDHELTAPKVSMDVKE